MLKISGNNLADGFVASVRQNPSQTALEVAHEYGASLGFHSLTYEQLGKLVDGIAHLIQKECDEYEGLIGVLAHRSVPAYSGILGILCSGNGYVPLSPKFPHARNAQIVGIAGLKTLIVGEECIDELSGLLNILDSNPEEKDRTSLTIISVTPLDAELAARHPSHQFINIKKKAGSMKQLEARDVNPKAIAYLLFTSGSTGVPKGVPVSHSNAIAYIDYMYEWYRPSQNDRMSQFFELTFDPSVHDQFLCWKAGACLCSVPQKYTMFAASFIQSRRLTTWYSVPSAGMMLARRKLLKPNSFPDLRISLFSGEALPQTLAEQWQAAAPNAILENLYGPTEATINITLYRWNNYTSAKECVNGVVPIGFGYEGQKIRVAHLTSRKSLEIGLEGELCLSGSQVVEQYFQNPEKTAEQFETYDQTRWYKTGDLVRQGPNGCIYYLGRIDNQIQILGHRVEMQEVDHALREAADTDLAVAIPWPVQAGRADGIIAFVAKSEDHRPAEIIKKCAEKLPTYMIPKEVRLLDEMPLNPSGKIDRKKLTEILQNN